LISAISSPHVPVGAVVLMAMFGAVLAGLTVALPNPADSRPQFVRSSEKGYPLKQAAERCNADLVRELIAMGASPDAYPEHPEDDRSPLLAAVSAGSAEIVRMLIDAGADVNRTTGPLVISALDETIDDGNVELARLLLEHGADATGSLGDAILRRRGDILTLLLQHGADVHALETISHPGPDECATLLVEIGEKKLAADLACKMVGVSPPAWDEELGRRARELESVFLAWAERYKLLGDHASATRLCEWKTERWKWSGLDLNRESSLVQMSACFRLRAQIFEQQGDVAEALRICREALARWDFDPRDDSWRLSWSGKTQREELAALLGDSERIFGRLGIEDERIRLVAARQMAEKSA